MLFSLFLSVGYPTIRRPKAHGPYGPWPSPILGQKPVGTETNFKAQSQPLSLSPTPTNHSSKTAQIPLSPFLPIGVSSQLSQSHFQYSNGQQLQLHLLREARPNGQLGGHQCGLSLLRFPGTLLVHQPQHQRHG